MAVNSEKLYGELLAAGIDISGCNSSGEVWLTDGTRIQDRADVAGVLAAHDPKEEVQTVIDFKLPLRAPSITVDDIFVESRDIKDDPNEAFAEALAEAGKAKGQAKSLDLIVRSMLRKIEQLEKRLSKLEKPK